MNSRGKLHAHHVLLLVLAAASALSLGACNQGPSIEKAGKDSDRAIVDGGRGWEQAADIADQKANQAADVSSAKSATAGKSTADVALSAKVRSALSTEPGLQALSIDVNAVNGAVTLYGTADTAARRDKAAQVALNVDGVKSVTNHLIILKGS